MTDLYCDVEVAGRLSFDVLSIGIVSSSGRECYVENGAWAAFAHIDEFAHENVLPQFGRVANASATDALELGRRFAAFLESERPPYTLHAEQPGVFQALRELLSLLPAGAALPALLSSQTVSHRVSTALGNLAAARSYSLDPLQRLRKDHALADARALKARCEAEQGLHAAGGVPSDKDVVRQFLSDQGTDSRGRMLSQMLSWDDGRLLREGCIQWMFPLPEHSPHNPEAPAPTLEEFAELAMDDAVKAGVTRASARLLTLLGLEFDGAELRRAPNWSAKCGAWAPWETVVDRHITRMLRCATLLGLRAPATKLGAGLETIVREYRGARADRTVAFWRGAVRPL